MAKRRKTMRWTPEGKKLFDEMKRVGSRGRAHVRIGVLAGDKAAEDHDGITNAELMAIQEFGLGVPERSSIRRTFSEHEDEVREMSAKLARGVMRGKITVASGLEIMGQWGAAEVKKTITADDNLRQEVPNADATIEAKGHARPLVGGNLKKGEAGGQLANSVSYKVVM